MVRKNGGKSNGACIQWLPFALLLFQSYVWSDSTPKLQSGTYWNDAAIIGVDGDRLTGSIDATVGENGSYVCQFFFDGKMIGRQFSIVCSNFIDPGHVEGSITVINSKTIILNTRENPGCSNMIASFEEDGDTLKLNKGSPVLQVRIVKAEKAFFYTTADSSTKKKAYLVAGDVALVYEKLDVWLKVIYGKTSGWMRAADMKPLSE
jgi:hypothetical protein